MNICEIANTRLSNQQIAETRFKSVKEIVGWMGAMQAQDFNMAKWAIGIRLPNSTEKLIDSAIDKGEIIRTHLMRPTWHFVSADDIYWMLELTAPQIKAAMKYRDKELKLTPEIYKKSNEIIEKALTGGKHLSRDALISELQIANITTSENRASHLLFGAELDGILCSGRTCGGRHMYALLRERCPKTKTLNRDEALAKLALKYFNSHNPATIQDFAWWSGLSITEAKSTMEMVKSNFISETIDKQTFWFSNSDSQTYRDLAYLLPAYDEFLISYKDRTASMASVDSAKAVSSNGIFRPMIVVNGQVIGIWKRTINKEKVILETTFFQPPVRGTKKMIDKAIFRYAQFIGKKI
jgi:hypothetical protein